MAASEEKSNNFYAVLGLTKECTASELRNAYKKLALRWHPDRCTALGNSKFVEEAKKKFQAIQEAYSVLSDANKRFLYDVGAYDSDDDENGMGTGMGGFLGEMAVMMRQVKSEESGQESFEDLKELFQEMFQRDKEEGVGSSSGSTPSCFSSSSVFSSNKRTSSDMSSGSTKVNDYPSFDSDDMRGFCFGTGGRESKGGKEGRRRRWSRAEKG